jgi:hypothetical protein
MANKFEALVPEHVLNIAAGAAKEVIDADYVCSLGKQAFAKMRPQKAGPTGNQYSLFEVHEGIALETRGVCTDAGCTASYIDLHTSWAGPVQQG